MLRPFAYEFFLFLLPFAVWFFVLLALREDPFRRQSWAGRRLAALVAAGLVCMLVGLALFGHFRNSPAGSVYVPAHLENGKLVGPQMK